MESQAESLSLRRLQTPLRVGIMIGCGLAGAGLAGAEQSLVKCPSSPNCVSSVDVGNSRYVAPFVLASTRAHVWPRVRDAVSSLQRTRIVQHTHRYLHAECRSRIFGFVDDLELEIDDTTGIVSVRSASRVGYSDFGVNRKRVERLRTRLLGMGLIRGQ